MLHNSHTLGLLKNEARNLRHMSTAKVKVQRIMEWLTFLQLRNTSWLVPSYRSVSITHSFHFGIIFSSFGAKAFASLQQYPFQIYRCFIPKNISKWYCCKDINASAFILLTMSHFWSKGAVDQISF